MFTSQTNRRRIRYWWIVMGTGDEASTKTKKHSFIGYNSSHNWSYLCLRVEWFVWIFIMLFFVIVICVTLCSVINECELLRNSCHSCIMKGESWVCSCLSGYKVVDNMYCEGLLRFFIDYYKCGWNLFMKWHAYLRTKRNLSNGRVTPNRVKSTRWYLKWFDQARYKQLSDLRQQTCFL